MFSLSSTSYSGIEEVSLRLLSSNSFCLYVYPYIYGRVAENDEWEMLLKNSCIVKKIKRVFFWQPQEQKNIFKTFNNFFLWYLVMKNSSNIWHFSEAEVCSYVQNKIRTKKFYNCINNLQGCMTIFRVHKKNCRNFLCLFEWM